MDQIPTGPSDRYTTQSQESRPINGRPWEYNFYLDCEGSMKDNKLKAAIKELQKDATFVKVLGSYKSAGKGGIN